MSNKIIIKEYMFLSRLKYKISIYSVLLFGISILLNFILKQKKVSLSLFIVLYIYILYCFFNSINYIYKLSFYEKYIKISYFKFNLKKEIYINLEHIKIKRIYNTIGLTNLPGNYLVFYNKEKKMITQYETGSWTFELMKEIKEIIENKQKNHC